MCAFILTRIDYCNAVQPVLANLPDSALAPLQRVLHAAARFVAAIGPRDYITPTLISLHWLPVRQRITYKLCTMMHSVFYSQAPSYISDIVTPVTHLPGRTFGEKRRLQHSTCTLWIRSAFVLGVWSLDLMPGTVCLVRWEASLLPQPSSVT